MGNPASENVHDVARKLRTAAPEDLRALLAHYGEDPRSGVRQAAAAAEKRLAAHEQVRAHTAALYSYQRDICDGIVVGIDEVGRGAVAGPLTVAAVVLPDEPQIIGLDDSKKLTPARREQLARQIRQVATAIGIAHIPPEDIDERGMAVSLRTATSLALESVGVDPDAVLIDGTPMHIHPDEVSVIRGDGKVACIAAASIIAKVTRDSLMVIADSDYPGYGFASCKGYASPEHIDAIRELGVSEYHRKTFCTGFLEEQGTLF